MRTGPQVLVRRRVDGILNTCALRQGRQGLFHGRAKGMVDGGRGGYRGGDRGGGGGSVGKGLNGWFY
ncbi:MAG: hypothetical protein ACK532_12970 [Acidobacteriota bacterium]